MFSNPAKEFIKTIRSRRSCLLISLPIHHHPLHARIVLSRDQLTRILLILRRTVVAMENFTTKEKEEKEKTWRTWNLFFFFLTLNPGNIFRHGLSRILILGNPRANEDSTGR